MTKRKQFMIENEDLLLGNKRVYCFYDQSEVRVLWGVCKKCGAVYHKECWQLNNNRCVNYGYDSHEFVLISPD